MNALDLKASSQCCHGSLLARIGWNTRWADRERSILLAKSARDRAKETAPRNSPELGLSVLTLAWQDVWRGQFDAALDRCLKVEELLPEHEHAAYRGHVYSILGVIYCSRNRLDLAECAIERGFRVVDPDTAREAFVDLLSTRSVVQRYSGDKSRAGLTLGRARNLAAGAEVARIEHNIARWLLSDGAFEKGIVHAEIALDQCRSSNNRVVLPYAYEVLGACLSALGQFDRARQCYADGLQIADEDQDLRSQCQILACQAELEMDQGDLEKARELYVHGGEVARSLSYALWQSKFARALADVYEASGDLKSAVAEHKKAWKIEQARRT